MKKNLLCPRLIEPKAESITCLKSVGRKNNLVSTRDFDKQGQEAFFLFVI